MMFTSENIKATFKAMKLRLVDADDGPRRLAELQFVIDPFTSALANEIDASLADHLFTFPAEPTSSPRGDVLDMKFASGSALFSLLVRFVPDDDTASVRLSGVGVSPLHVRIPDPEADRPRLVLTLTVQHVIDPATDLRGLVHLFGGEVYLSFSAQQGDLLAADEGLRSRRIVEALTDPENPILQKHAKRMANRGLGISSIEVGERRLDIDAKGNLSRRAAAKRPQMSDTGGR